MDAALAGLLGTAVGAVVGLLGSVIRGWQEERADHRRAQHARTDEVTKQQRQSLLELVRLIATGVQAVSWVAWAVNTLPDQRVYSELVEYDSGCIHCYRTSWQLKSLQPAGATWRH
jgi:hypothetical protein